jgi:hypothetical protein
MEEVAREEADGGTILNRNTGCGKVGVIDEDGPIRVEGVRAGFGLDEVHGLGQEGERVLDHGVVHWEVEGMGAMLSGREIEDPERADGKGDVLRCCRLEEGVAEDGLRGAARVDDLLDELARGDGDDGHLLGRTVAIGDRHGRRHDDVKLPA